jgi:type IV pilus assembly protein PilM
MFSSDKILAIDIGAATIKVGEFQMSKTHGLRLINFNHADLGLDPEHEEERKSLIVAAIRSALREKNIKARHVVFSVSGQSVFTRFVKLPPVEESKVEQIIQYEAQQNVPFPIDEVIWDHQLLGSTEQGELEVVLLAIKSDIIEDLNEGVESAGLHTEIVDVAPMALINAVRYNEGEIDGCTMVVDIGARTTNLLFLEKSRIYSRPIPIAGNAITQGIAAEFNIPFLDAEQLKRAKGFVALGGAYEEPADEQQARVSKIIRNVMTRLHSETTRSINYWKGQQGGKAPTRLLLSGGSSVMPYTDRFFQEKLQLPVQLFNPLRNVEIGEQVSREELAKCAHFFGEIVGLGLRRVTHCPLEVNLLPKSIQDRKKMQLKRPYFFGAALAVLLIPLCWLMYANKTTELKNRELREVRAEVTHLSQLAATIRSEQDKQNKLKANADQVVELWRDRAVWFDFFDDFSRRMVSNVWITAFIPEPCGTANTTSAAALGVRDGRRGGQPAAMSRPIAGQPSAATLSGCAEVRIEGAGLGSADALRLVDDLAHNLSQSTNFVDKSVVIERPPSAMTHEATFTFTIRAWLAKPVSIISN